MFDVPINYWAVLVAGLSSVVLGGLWYGPVFGKVWMRLSGVHPDMDSAKGKALARRGYTIAFVGALITAYVLSHFGWYAGAVDLVGGLQVGFWAWLGFVGPVTLGMVLWEGKPWKLWILLNGYNLLFLLVAGAIVSAWR